MDYDTLEAVRHWTEGYLKTVVVSATLATAGEDPQSRGKLLGRSRVLLDLLDQIDKWEVEEK